MKIYDITVPITAGMPVWPGDPPVTLEPVFQIGAGHRSNVSHLTLPTHAGTHIDPPRHFIADGATVDQIPLEALVGPADVVYLPEAEVIDAATLAALSLPPDCQRLLLRTRNSLYWARGDRAFHEDYVGMTTDAARWVVQRGIRVIGADYLAVSRYGDDAVPVHRTLLEADVFILEGLDLHQITPGRYQLVCLPLKIAAGDGAPMRAILIS